MAVSESGNSMAEAGNENSKRHARKILRATGEQIGMVVDDDRNCDEEKEND